jgi:hypothetical protein
MDDLEFRAGCIEQAGDEAAVSAAVTALYDIASQLRELADYAAMLCDEPIFEPKLH